MVVLEEGGEVGVGLVVEELEPGLGDFDGLGELEDRGGDGGVLDALLGGLEEGESGAASGFLDMDEGGGELDEAFIEFAGIGASDGEPDFFEDVVGFVEAAGIEAMGEGDEGGGVVGVFWGRVGVHGLVTGCLSWGWMGGQGWIGWAEMGTKKPLQFGIFSVMVQRLGSWVRCLGAGFFIHGITVDLGGCWLCRRRICGFIF